MAGTIVADIHNTSSGVFATQNAVTGAAKAWAKFQGGNGNTAGVILGYFNVSSITVNGTGDYTVNFTTAMADINYSAQANCLNGTVDTSQMARAATPGLIGGWSTSSVRIGTFVTSNAAMENQKWVTVAIFGN